MRIAVACVLCLAMTGASPAQVAQISSQGARLSKPVVVSADTGTTVRTIPADFVGFSVEVQDFVVKGYFQGTSGVWNSQASASSFISLLSLLGANGSLRLGGSTADAGTVPPLTQQMATNLQAFLAALGAGWKPIYNLDLTANNSALAATQAGYMATAFGAANVIFQMGNEPVASGDFTIGTYQTAWNAYYAAITAAVPTAKFASWDDYSFGNTQTVINGLTPGVSGLSLVSYHWYNINGQVPSTSYFLNSIDQASSAFSANTVWAGSVPQRFTESNSVNIGGQSGISDKMMSATWYLTEAITLARLGYAGINTHMFFTGESTGGNAGQGWYNPVIIQADQTSAPGPIFYGMYLFSQIQGQQIINSSVSGNAKVAAIATLRTAGKANFVVANVDMFDTVPVTVQQVGAWSTANVLKVASPTGQGCTESAPTLGGQAIGKSGAWSGAPISISNGQSFSLGPCEAALVSVQ